MRKDSKKSRRFSKSFILGALLLYVAFGIVSLGYYYQYYIYSPKTEEETVTESAELTEEEPLAEDGLVSETPDAVKYDTDEGNAGAARDLDIE